MFYQQLRQGEAMLGLAAQLRQGEAVLGLAAQACRLLRLYRLNAAKLIFAFSKTTKLTDLYTILGLDFNPI